MERTVDLSKEECDKCIEQLRKRLRIAHGQEILKRSKLHSFH